MYVNMRMISIFSFKFVCKYLISTNRCTSLSKQHYVTNWYIWKAFFCAQLNPKCVQVKVNERHFVSSWKLPTEHINLMRNLADPIKVTNITVSPIKKKSSTFLRKHVRTSRICAFIRRLYPSTKPILFSHQRVRMRLYLISFSEQSS